MAYSASFLLSSDAASGRMDERKPSFVVHVEVEPLMHQELDADSVRHAQVLAQQWLALGWARSAAVRSVNADGTLSDVIGDIASSAEDLDKYVGPSRYATGPDGKPLLLSAAQPLKELEA